MAWRTIKKFNEDTELDKMIARVDGVNQFPGVGGEPDPMDFVKPCVIERPQGTEPLDCVDLHMPYDLENKILMAMEATKRLTQVQVARAQEHIDADAVQWNAFAEDRQLFVDELNKWNAEMDRKERDNAAKFRMGFDRDDLLGTAD